MMNKKIIFIISAMLALSMVLSSCSPKNADSDEKDEPKMSAELKELTQNTVKAVIELENGDEINLELYPDLAPETVENFVELADEGFYDGTIFHRVIEGFVIQGGGYDEDLNALKAGTIDGEFTSNGFKNELSHTRGVISMARAQDPDSASSQFFIVQEDSENLDGEYAAFGRVTDDESLDVVDDIASVSTGRVSSAGLDDVPITPVVIKTIKISTGSSSLLDDEDSKSDKSSKSSKSKSNSDDSDSNSKSGRSSEDSDDSGVDDEALKSILEGYDDAQS